MLAPNAVVESLDKPSASSPTSSASIRPGPRNTLVRQAFGTQSDEKGIRRLLLLGRTQRAAGATFPDGRFSAASGVTCMALIHAI